MKTLHKFLNTPEKALAVLLTFLALLIYVPLSYAQLVGPYINPANVRFTGGTINGVSVGATTSSTGAFSTLSASGAVSGAGFSAYLASPPAIGGTAAAAGSFTTLASSGAATLNSAKIGGSSDLFLTRYGAKQLMISGDGVGATTNTGWILGHLGVSGYAGLWPSTIVPSTTNYIFAADVNSTSFNSAITSYFNIGGVNKLVLTNSLLTSAIPFSVTDATDSSSTTTGSLKTAGGLGVVKKSFFGDSINVAAPGTLSVGTGSGTSAGLIAGYLGTSGYGAIWSTGVTPSVSNFAFITNGAGAAINGTTSASLQIANAAKLSVTSTNITHVGDMIYDKTITAAGTTGAQTINKTTGRVNFAAAATSLVVTNSLATANSICHVTKATNNAAMRLGACVAAAGNITIYADVAPDAETAVNFTLTN